MKKILRFELSVVWVITVLQVSRKSKITLVTSGNIMTRTKAIMHFYLLNHILMMIIGSDCQSLDFGKVGNIQ